MDILQAVSSRTWSCCSASTSTRCSPTGRCPSRRPSRSPPGRTLIVELDSWYLPDTAATSYRREHVKTSVAVEAIDPPPSGCATSTRPALYELAGEDYRGVFRRRARAVRGCPAALHGARALRRRQAACADEELRDACARPAARPSRAPAGLQPVRALRRAARARPAATARGRRQRLSRVRICDGEDGGLGIRGRRLPGAVAARGRRRSPPARRCRRIVEGCKILSFRLARRRAFDPGETLSTLAAAWEEAMAGSMTPSPDTRARSAPGTRIEVDSDELSELSDGLAGGALRRPDAARATRARSTRSTGCRPAFRAPRRSALQDAGDRGSRRTLRLRRRGLVVSHEL